MRELVVALAVILVDDDGLGARGDPPSTSGRFPRAQTLSSSATTQSPDRTRLIPGVVENSGASDEMAASGSTPSPASTTRSWARFTNVMQAGMLPAPASHVNSGHLSSGLSVVCRIPRRPGGLLQCRDGAASDH